MIYRWSGYSFCSENCQEAVIEALCGENAPESDSRLESYAKEATEAGRCANHYGCKKLLKTKFTLGVRLDPRVKLTDDNQLEVPPELVPVDRKVAKDLDVIETPFVIMTAAHWNRMQKAFDDLNVREQIRVLNLSVIPVHRLNVLRMKS